MKLVTVLDCKDPKALAPFWAAALGYKEVASAGQYVVLGTGDRTQHELILQGVDEPKTAKNRMHLDLNISDARQVGAEEGRRRVDAEVRRLKGLGAMVGRAYEENGEHWVVMADPEGNEFCVH